MNGNWNLWPCPVSTSRSSRSSPRYRYPGYPNILDLEFFPELVLFGQPQQPEPKIYAARMVAARNLFTISPTKGSRLENVLLITNGFGYPSAAFLDKCKF
jgi:hypothetical protein